MLFEVYGALAAYQWIGWVLVFAGLIVLNEIGRRTKIGGIMLFVVLPILMTIYCVAVTIGAAQGASWAANNPTVLFQNGWFHYAKVYAALIGCVGFMAIKYHWGHLGKAHWFKAFPFVIVAINILIAVASDFESAAHFFTGNYFVLDNGSPAWMTSEQTIVVCGWNNVFNGIAGILNIFIMTGWWAVFSSKKQHDMIWADMTWVYIVAYDIWNFTYTYNNLPSHAWYCGFALLLAPTVANALWNKGGWIQNRAFTLAIWCMFAQVFPQFQNSFPEFGLNSPFAVQSTLNIGVTTTVAALALAANVAGLAYVAYRAYKLGINPYKQEVFVGTHDFVEAYKRIDPRELESQTLTPAHLHVTPLAHIQAPAHHIAHHMH